MHHQSSNRSGRGCEPDRGAHAAAMGNREGGERSRPGAWTRWGREHAGGVEDGLVCDVTVDGPRGSRSCLDSYPRPSPRLVPRGGRHQPPPRRRTSSARERRRGGTVARNG
jgi:hypothetical protein